MSTGLTSHPNMPNIPNRAGGFTGPVVHTSLLGKQYSLVTAPEVDEVVVVGGSKSAIETVCLCIDAGKFVHWIIRYV
jgi:dimethylaniline monooxygenase (N-oxide forming)